MNKYEKLIDRLADKTLSFGCELKLNDVTYQLIFPVKGKMFTKVKNMDATANPIVDLAKYKIIGHPVTIGRVLEVVKNNYLEDKGIGFYHCGEVVQAWLECGTERSLNEILESTYLVTPVDKHPIDATPEDPMLMDEPRLKDSNAEALFTFLINLFKNET
jgi:hypothetical protein